MLNGKTCILVFTLHIEPEVYYIYSYILNIKYLHNRKF